MTSPVTRANALSRFGCPPARGRSGRGVHGAAEGGLGDHEQPAGARVHQQRLGVVRAVRVGERVAARGPLVGAPAGHDPVDVDARAAPGVVADVARPDHTAPARRERLDVVHLGGVRRPADQPAGAGVEPVDHRVVAGVVGGVDDRAGVDQAAGLEDVLVGDREQRPARDPLAVVRVGGRADRQAQDRQRDGAEACLEKMPRQRAWHPRPVRQGGGARAQRAAPSADNAAGRDAGPRTRRQVESHALGQPVTQQLRELGVHAPGAGELVELRAGVGDRRRHPCARHAAACCAGCACCPRTR